MLRFSENVLVRMESLFDKEPVVFLLCNIGKAYDQESLSQSLHVGNRFTLREYFSHPDSVNN